jgi:hypothetical protein
MMSPGGWDHPEFAHLIKPDTSDRVISRQPRFADSSGSSLRDEIRHRLAAGTLPRTAGHAWMGAAGGDRRCACCAQPIAGPASECVVRDRVELYAHAACFRLWVEESNGPVAKGWWAPTGAAVPRPHLSESQSSSASSIPRRWRAR